MSENVEIVVKPEGEVSEAESVVEVVAEAVTDNTEAVTDQALKTVEVATDLAKEMNKNDGGRIDQIIFMLDDVLNLVRGLDVKVDGVFDRLQNVEFNQQLDAVQDAQEASEVIEAVNDVVDATAEVITETANEVEADETEQPEPRAKRKRFFM